MALKLFPKQPTVLPSVPAQGTCQPPVPFLAAEHGTGHPGITPTFLPRMVRIAGRAVLLSLHGTKRLLAMSAILEMATRCQCEAVEMASVLLPSSKGRN